jgi:hypothetical protein
VQQMPGFLERVVLAIRFVRPEGNHACGAEGGKRNDVPGVFGYE